jgi:hypothetical protein
MDYLLVFLSILATDFGAWLRTKAETVCNSIR